MNAPLPMLTTVAVMDENHAGGHLAQVEVEDLLPRIHLPLNLRIHLPLPLLDLRILRLALIVHTLMRVAVERG